MILFVYFLTMLSLPVFMWRRHRDSFSPFRHVAIPALGSLTLIVPFVELCQPGQPAPYSAFPFIALAIDDIWAPVLLLGNPRWQALGAPVSRAVVDVNQGVR